MNRRTFLKSIAAVCGAAVVCPGELVKGEPVEFRPNPVQRVYMIDHPIFHNVTRQQGMTTIIYDEFATRRDEMFISPLIIGAYDEKIQTTN